MAQAGRRGPFARGQRFVLEVAAASPRVSGGSSRFGIGHPLTFSCVKRERRSSLARWVPASRPRFCRASFAGDLTTDADTCSTPPSYRGLTTIQALTPSPPPTLSSSFSSASSSSASSSSTSLSSLDFESIDAPPQSPHSLLTSSFPPTTLFTPSCPPLRPATFAIPPTYANTAVNLRTFGGQPAKYASVSDLVVYGSDGIDPALGWEGVGERLTEVLKTAIEAVEAEKDRRRKAVLKCADYKVYVVSGELGLLFRVRFAGD